MGEDEDDELPENDEANYSQRGLVLYEIESEKIAHMLAGSGSDHIRVIWQGNVAIVWPMRLRPPDYVNVAD